VSADWAARLWDALTGKAIGEPMKHEAPVTSAQFSPDGQRVVTTAAWDGAARLWDAASAKAIGEPMKHEGLVTSAQFSPDGQRVVTASGDTARIWDVPNISSNDSAEDLLLLADLAEATGGFALQISGRADIRDVLSPAQVRKTREKIAGRFAGPSSRLTPLQRFLKWSVSERTNRTISPFSDITVAEWMENRINDGTLHGLQAAVDVDPANARLAAHLGRALADYALRQDTNPGDAHWARSEADFQTRRALKLAPDNDEVNKLRTEVVNLLQLSSE
jgi:dipeptidyl aminopeptidase/acylaminoacyl peptidase